MKASMFNKKGFTLIELLIVVLLIGVLSGIALSVINPRGIRAKSRDGQRIGDLKTIQVALETYYSDKRKYPEQVTISFALIDDSQNGLSELVTGNYINLLPADPLGGGLPSDIGSVTCDGQEISSYGYYYKRLSSSEYKLLAIMEIITSGSDETSYCEIVENPL